MAKRSVKLVRPSSIASFSLIAVMAMVGSCTKQNVPDATLGKQAQVRQWLAGDFIGEGSRGNVYHRILPLNVPALGGEIIYHHISRERVGGESFQRKYYVFDANDNAMRSTVLLGSVESMGDPAALTRHLNSLSGDDLLKFPLDCVFIWTQQDEEWIAELADEHCAYDSPAFGGRVSPKMTYRLGPCSLAIDEAIYRQDGSPVFPPSSIHHRRVNPRWEQPGQSKSPAQCQSTSLP